MADIEAVLGSLDGGGTARFGPRLEDRAVETPADDLDGAVLQPDGDSPGRPAQAGDGGLRLVDERPGAIGVQAPDFIAGADQHALGRRR